MFLLMFQKFLFNNILYFCKNKLKNLDDKLKYDITNCDHILRINIL